MQEKHSTWKTLFSDIGQGFSSAYDSVSGFLGFGSDEYDASTKYGSYQDYAMRDDYGAALDESAGFNWYDKAMGAYETGKEYFDKGVDYVRKPLDYAKRGYESLPTPFQDFIEGKLGAGRQPKGDGGSRGRRAQAPRFNLGNVGSSGRASFNRRRTNNFQTAINSYKGSPLAQRLMNDAATNDRIRQIASQQLSAMSGTSPNITVNQAKNAIYTYLSRRNT